MTYLLDNTVNSTVYGNNVQTFYTYDCRARPTRIQTVREGSTLLDLNYTYDGTGNVLSINDESYSYDALNRLTGLDGPWGSITYVYDGVGNRLADVRFGVAAQYTYGSYNRLTQAVLTGFSYDNAGNMVSRYN